MPSAFVVVVVRTLVSVLVATTAPPATTAPVGSVAVPVMDAVIVCAGASAASTAASTTRRQIFFNMQNLSLLSFVETDPYFTADPLAPASVESGSGPRA